MNFDFIGPLSPAYAEFDNFFRFYFNQKWLESLLIRCGIKITIAREIERQLNAVNAGTMDISQMKRDLEDFLIFIQDVQEEVIPALKQFPGPQSNSHEAKDRFVLYKMAASVFPENTSYLISLTEKLLSVLPKKAGVDPSPAEQRKKVLAIL